MLLPHYCRRVVSGFWAVHDQNYVLRPLDTHLRDLFALGPLMHARIH